jgi:hypothetical protein
MRTPTHRRDRARNGGPPSSSGGRSARPLARTALALAAAAAIASLERPARAGELQIGAAAGGQGSSWRGDGAGLVGIKLGYRFVDIVAPYFLARIGYANTNQRVLEMLQLGVQLWARIGITRPYLRLGVIHQHEEPWASIQADSWGALLGVGDGIRHRAGFEGALGVDIPFKQIKDWQIHGTVEGFATGFPDSKGPVVYGGGTLGIGFNYTL